MYQCFCCLPKELELDLAKPFLKPNSSTGNPSPSILGQCRTSHMSPSPPVWPGGALLCCTPSHPRREEHARDEGVDKAFGLFESKERQRILNT